MTPYTLTDLDALFSLQFEKKLEQYQLLNCLPPGKDTPEALVPYTLQLLQAIHPVLAVVLDAELALGNRVRTVCRWPGSMLLDITLTQPFRQSHKARHLDYLLVKDPYNGAGATCPYQQYTTPRAPGQRLLADSMYFKNDLKHHKKTSL